MHIYSFYTFKPEFFCSEVIKSTEYMVEQNQRALKQRKEDQAYKI